MKSAIQNQKQRGESREVTVCLTKKIISSDRFLAHVVSEIKCLVLSTKIIEN